MGELARLKDYALGDWQELAQCRGRDPEIFYPQRGVPTASAKTLCRECPVKSECLEYALVNEERFGIWGGLSERERKKLHRERRRKVQINQFF